MKRLLRHQKLIHALIVLALLLHASPAFAQTPAPTPIAPTVRTATATPVPQSAPSATAVSPQARASVDSGYTVGQCSNINRETLRNEIQAAALAVEGSSTGRLDIDAMVDRNWRDLDVDAVVDAEVARAVATLQQDESYWNRLLSGWSASKAEEFAQRVALDAFTSDAFAARINELAAAIGVEIARQVNANLAGAASTAFLCLRDYVGSAYSEPLFAAFSENVTLAVTGPTTLTDTLPIDIGIVDTHGGLITGAGIIVVTQVGARVATRISEKLAERVAGKIIGRVLGRAGSTFVPVAGWVVGIALIVWDLVEGGKGALPQIQEALTSEDAKVRIRTEVADAVRAGLPEEAAIASLETAVSMLEEWDRFCTDYANVCTLAEDKATFRSLLGSLPLGELDDLERLADVFLNNLGRVALDQALETGTFDELLMLQEPGRAILTDTGSVDRTLAWAAVAGSDLPQVAGIGIHRFAAPDEVTRNRLDKLLAWNDGVAVRKFLLLDAPVRDVLWPLGGQTLFTLVSQVDDAQLNRFGYGLARWATADHQRIAGDFVAGARTLAEVEAGPTPAPTFGPPTATASPQPTGRPTTTPPGAPPTNPLDSDTQRITLLGVLVVLLALLSAILIWRRGRGRP